MISIVHLLFLTLFFISENNFKDSILSEDYAKLMSIKSFSSSFMYIPSTTESVYEHATSIINYSDDILEKGNKSIAICFVFDILLSNQNFLTKCMFSNQSKNYLCDYGGFNLEKISPIRSSTDSSLHMVYRLNVRKTHRQSYIVSNYLISLSNNLLRVNWFYLAKFLSKPKYASVCFNQNYSKPK